VVGEFGFVVAFVVGGLVEALTNFLVVRGFVVGDFGFVAVFSVGVFVESLGNFLVLIAFVVGVVCIVVGFVGGFLVVFVSVVVGSCLVVVVVVVVVVFGGGGGFSAEDVDGLSAETLFLGVDISEVDVVFIDFKLFVDDLADSVSSTLLIVADSKVGDPSSDCGFFVE